MSTLSQMRCPLSRHFAGLAGNLRPPGNPPAIPPIRSTIAALALLFTVPVHASSAQISAAPPAPASTVAIPHSPALQELVDGAVKQALDKFAPQKLGTNQVAVTLVDLRDPQKPVAGQLPRRRADLSCQRHQALLPGGRASLDGGRQAEGHSRTPPRHARHDRGFSQRGDRLPGGLPYRHHQRTRAEPRRKWTSGITSATR